MLLVDTRAGSGQLIPLLAGLATGFTGEGTTADVVICGNGPDGAVTVGVEVKTVDDLLSSEATGRLAETQLPSMLDTYPYVWLLVIGEYRAGHTGRLEISARDGRWRTHPIGHREVPYSYLESFVTEVQVMGVSYRQVSDYRMAAIWITAAYHWWSKPWDKHRAMRKIDRSKEQGLIPNLDPNTKQMVKIAHQLPNVGYERAFAAAGMFANARCMANATAREWAQVPGIGTTIAAGIVDAWGGVYRGR